MKLSASDGCATDKTCKHVYYVNYEHFTKLKFVISHLGRCLPAFIAIDKINILFTIEILVKFHLYIISKACKFPL